MKGLMEREFIAQLVIVLGLSLGGWMLFVQPKAKQFDEMQAVLQTVARHEPQLSKAAIEDLADMLAQSRNRIDSIAYHNKLAENTTLLFGMVSNLGAKTGVTVQSLTPELRATPRTDAGCRTVRLDMVLEGRYEHVAAFVESVLRLPGFLRPVALTVRPVGDADDGLIAANFSCEIVQFAIPDELAEIGVVP